MSISTQWDAIVVGAGPAGLTAVRTLLEGGWRVCLLDAGERPAPLPPRMDLWVFRQNPCHWRWFLGDRLESFRTPEQDSPKLRTPAAQAVLAGYSETLGIETEGFRVIGSLAPGGLSNVWGAGVACFDGADLSDWPVPADALQEAYITVARRIGVSGSAEDDLADYLGLRIPLQPPLPLDPPADVLYRRYQQHRRRVQAAGLILGRSRNAVLTEPMGRREACTRCGFCLYGCGYQAIYHAALELEDLRRHPGLTYVPGQWAERLDVGLEGPRLTTLDRRTGERHRWTASVILLACGTLATTRLVLDALGSFDRPVRLLSQPSMGFALWLPKCLAQPYLERFFGLAQLSFVVTSRAEGGLPIAAGNLFLACAVPLWELTSRFPGPPIWGYRLLRDLVPSLLLGNALFAASLSDHTVTLGRDGKLKVRGGYRPELSQRLRQVTRSLRRGFRYCGAWLLPGSVRLVTPGADVHYAGTLPHRRFPRLGETDVMGAVVGLEGVYAIDASVLPSLPAKAHTFTVMANAHRIATAVLQRYRRAWVYQRSL